MQAEFERSLSAKIRIRRLITVCLTLVFLSMLILSLSLRESTKVVVVHTVASFMPPWTEVRYSNAYILPIILGLVGAIFSAVFLIVDLSMCGYRTIRKDTHFITVYRGIAQNTVYMDGRKQAQTGPFSISNVIEFLLPNQVRATVSFSRAVWYMARVSFSDDNASREL